MLIHAHPSGHVRSFPGIAHAVISINENGTFHTHVYVNDELRSAGMNCVPSENALEAVAANVKAAVEDVIQDDAVQAAINGNSASSCRAVVKAANRVIPGTRKAGGRRA